MKNKYPKKTLVQYYSNPKRKIMNLRTKISPSISSLATDVVTNRISNNNKIYGSPTQKSNPIKIQNKVCDEQFELNKNIEINKKKDNNKNIDNLIDDVLEIEGKKIINHLNESIKTTKEGNFIINTKNLFNNGNESFNIIYNIISKIRVNKKNNENNNRHTIKNIIKTDDIKIIENSEISEIKSEKSSKNSKNKKKIISNISPLSKTTKSSKSNNENSLINTNNYIINTKKVIINQHIKKKNNSHDYGSEKKKNKIQTKNDIVSYLLNSVLENKSKKNSGRMNRNERNKGKLTENYFSTREKQFNNKNIFKGHKISSSTVA